MFSLPATSRQHLYIGSTFFEVFRGIDAYTKTRGGQSVEGACGAATVIASVDSVVVGPLGQFLAPGQAHTSNIGRAYDVRSLADAVEASCSTGPKDTKVVDPRELYTCIVFRVAEVRDPAILAGALPA